MNARLDILEKKNSAISPAIIQKNIIQAIAPFGYYSPQININKKTIRINKGTPTLIQSIKVSIEGPGQEVIKRHFKNKRLVQNKVFNSEDFETTKKSLLDIAEQQGYLNAKFIETKALINKKNNRAQVIIHLKTGHLYYFGDITFEKTTAYNPLFLKRYLTFQKGQPFNTNQLLTLNAAFNDSAYFKNISIKPQIGNNINVPVNIYLHDKPSQNYLAGIGYVTDTGVRARLGSQWLRVNDYGHTFQALYVGSQRQNAIQGQYVIPGKNPTTDQYSFSSKIFQLRYPVGSSQAQQFTAASIFKKNKRLYTLSLNLLDESFNFIGSDKQTKKVLFPNIKIVHKKISSPIFSKSGLVLQGNLKYADKIIYSDVSFTQIDFSLKTAFWLKTHTRLVFKTHLGFTETDDINQLPLSLQLLAGGADSIRGYHFQSIGPGKVLSTGSAEIQQETIKDWFVTAFYDIGDVYKPSEKQWRRGVGGGIMWISPIGPIRLSVARALDDVGQPLRVILNMGPDL